MKFLSEEKGQTIGLFLAIYFPIVLVGSYFWEPYVETMVYNIAWGFGFTKNVAPYKIYLFCTTGVFLPIFLYQYFVISLIYKFIKRKEHFCNFASTGYGIYSDVKPKYLQENKKSDKEISYWSIAQKIIDL